MADIARPERKNGKRMFLWAGAIVATVLAAQFFFGQQPQVVDITSAHFTQEVEKGNIGKLHVTPRDAVSEVRGELKAPSSVTVSGRPLEFAAFRTYVPTGDAALTEMVLAKNPGIAITTGPPPGGPSTVVATWLPFLVLIAAWFFLIRPMRQRRTAQTES